MKRHFNLLLLGVVVLGLVVGAGLGALKPMSAQGSSARTNQSFSVATGNQQQGQTAGAPSGQGGSNASVGQGRTDGGNVGRGMPLTGSVASVQDGIVTVSTSQGDVKVKLGDAKIEKTVDGTVDDLMQGQRIVVIGQQGNDGTYSASTVQVVPQDAQDGQRGYGRQGMGGSGNGQVQSGPRSPQ